MTTRTSQTDAEAAQAAIAALAPVAIQAEEPTIDLLELLVVFLAEWRIGLLAALLAFLAGAAYTYLTRPAFVASATILPKQTFAESNSLSGLSGIFSGQHAEGLYTGLLKSRSVTDNVIRELNLIKPGSGQSWEDTRNGLLGSTTVTTAADGLLTITVRSADAQTAMKTANAWLDALHTQQQTMAMSQSVLNRQFYEQQLEQEKQALAAAENDLENTQRRTGIIEAGSQTAAGLGEIAGTRNQLVALQVQLAALLQSSTEQNPQVQTLRSQIARLEGEERAMQSGGATGPGAPTTAGRMPETNLEFSRKQRAVAFHQGLLNSLSAQYQNARLVEASSIDAFQVVDYAIVPERKAFPPRKTWLIFSAGFGVLTGVLAIFFVLIKRRLQADPDYRRHMSQIRRNFGLRR